MGCTLLSVVASIRMRRWCAVLAERASSKSLKTIGDTFRAVYTLRCAGRVYVLHAFQKKSKTGRETPRRDIELIKQRLREAELIARERKL